MSFAELASSVSVNFAAHVSDFRLQYEDCDVDPTEPISTLARSNELRLTVRCECNSIKVQRQSASGENLGARFS